MKTIHKISISSILSGIVFFAGCGDNSSVSDSKINYNQQNIFAYAPQNKVTSTEYVVNAEDDAIIGAKVEASECNASKDLGNGKYLLEGCVAKPKYISIVGGQIKGKDVNQTFPLILNTSQSNKDDNFVVSPITTLLVDANESEIKKIADDLNIAPNNLYKLAKQVTKVDLTNINQKLNAVYLSAQMNGVVAKKLQFIQTVRKKLNIKNDDINVTDLSKKVTEVSSKKPSMFGLVIINLSNNDNILKEVQEQQNPKQTQFLGLVFDDKMPDANISLYRTDISVDNPIYKTKAGSEGNWSVSANDANISKLVKDAKNDKSFILIMKAVDENNASKVLKSSISSTQIKEILKKTKRVTATNNPNFIISNITTAENAFLDKAKVLNANTKADIETYENKKIDIRTYDQDKILKVAAVIKDVIDNNASLDDYGDANNTYSLVTDSISTTTTGKTTEFNLTNDKINDANTTDLEKNITNNAILSLQLNTTTHSLNTKKDKITLKTMQNISNGVYYRLLAYYNNSGAFVREYDKIVMYPANYVEKRCYLYGDSTDDWSCDKSYTIKNSNYNSNGDFSVFENQITTNYSLEKNDSIRVNQLCKSYNIYEVTKQKVSGTDILKTTPEVLVDSFDVVDMFRRMPNDKPDNFNKLKNSVDGKQRDDVNSKMNRYIRDNLQDIKDYFSDSNNTCSY